MNSTSLTCFPKLLVPPLCSAVPNYSTRFRNLMFFLVSFGHFLKQFCYCFVWSRVLLMFCALWFFRSIGSADNIAIEGRNLNFSFTATRQAKAVPVLRDCSLRIPSGQFWMLLGPNGCGKSTLLKVFTYCFEVWAKVRVLCCLIILHRVSTSWMCRF